MPLTRRRLVVRRLAAILAGWALLALPLRTLLACPMLEPTGQGAVSVAVEEHAGHAGHDMDGGSGAEHQQAPADHHGPSHDACPDVAHCAAFVLRDVGLTLAPSCVDCADGVSDVIEHPVSAGRALDTPPPKRA